MCSVDKRLARWYFDRHREIIEEKAKDPRVKRVERYLRKIARYIDTHYEETIKLATTVSKVPFRWDFPPLVDPKKYFVSSEKVNQEDLGWYYSERGSFRCTFQ